MFSTIKEAKERYKFSVILGGSGAWQIHETNTHAPVEDGRGPGLHVGGPFGSSWILLLDGKNQVRVREEDTAHQLREVADGRPDLARSRALRRCDDALRPPDSVRDRLGCRQFRCRSREAVAIEDVRDEIRSLCRGEFSRVIGRHRLLDLRDQCGERFRLPVADERITLERRTRSALQGGPVARGTLLRVESGAASRLGGGVHAVLHCSRRLSVGDRGRREQRGERDELIRALLHRAAAR